MPGKMARSDPRPSVRVTRGAGSIQHLASVLQEGRENAKIDAGLGFIWRISAKLFRYQVDMSNTKNQSWSLIIFGFNEKDNLERVFRECADCLRAMAASEYEIIIVDDGSTDGTRQVAENILKTELNTIAIFHKENLGIGQTLLDGYRSARFENVCAVPADGQFDAKELMPFANFKDGSFVSFYREIRSGYSAYRNFLNRTNHWLNRVLGGITLRDVNWVKIYKNAALRSLKLRLTSSLVESEICGKLLRRGSECVETPSVYRPRATGVSKAGGLKSLTQVLRQTLLLYASLLMETKDPSGRAAVEKSGDRKQKSLP